MSEMVISSMCPASSDMSGSRRYRSSLSSMASLCSLTSSVVRRQMRGDGANREVVGNSSSGRTSLIASSSLKI